MQVSVILLAAGLGQRMGAAVNKIWLPLAGKPLLHRENSVTVIGSAPSSAAVSEFVARLSASGVFRSVNLASIERERNASTLDFEIDLEP